MHIKAEKATVCKHIQSNKTKVKSYKYLLFSRTF